MTLPVVFDVNVIAHWPLASVFAPAFVQVPVGAVWRAPFESVSVTATCSPAAGTKPAPSPVSFQSVTMNVCDWPTRLVAFGAIVIFASTQRLDATSELPAWPSVVARQRDPADGDRRVRRDDLSPVVVEVSVTVQQPVAPTVVQEGAERPPGPESS